MESRKRKKNSIIRKLIDEIDPKVKAQIEFEMECLNDWDTCHDDILEEAKEEGLPIGLFDSKILNLTKNFYLKGVNDAYKKLNHD